MSNVLLYNNVLYIFAKHGEGLTCSTSSLIQKRLWDTKTLWQIQRLVGWKRKKIIIYSNLKRKLVYFGLPKVYKSNHINEKYRLANWGCMEITGHVFIILPNVLEETILTLFDIEPLSSYIPHLLGMGQLVWGSWYGGSHYENKPIQIYNENLPPNNENFQIKKFWYFSYFYSKHRLWVLVRTALSRQF